MFNKIKEQYLLMAPPMLWLLIFFIVPLIIVLGYSFCISEATGGVKLEFTLGHYRLAFEGMYLYIFLKSFLYAGITTVITLAISFPMAYYMAFASPRMKMVMMLMIILPFWTNFLIRMYSLMTLLGESGLINSMLLNLGIVDEPLPMMNNSFGMYVGFVYWNLPFMILPIASSLDRIDVSLLEASLDLGASGRRL